MRRSNYSLRVVLFCIAAMSTFITVVSGKTIPADVAQTVATNFFKQNANLQANTASLAYTERTSTGEAVYFAFNINPVGYSSNGKNPGKGFVIVVADDAQSPIIGYSTECSYVNPPAGSNAAYWMDKRKKEIIANRALQVQPTDEISAQWTAYIAGEIIEKRTTGSVAPLVQTMWDQPYPYNALCPGGSVTGCVATTMAQIMRYWKYPAKGTGSSSYNSSYGRLSADYGTTTYDWDNMPYTGVSTDNDVDTLMYQCGVSVDMQYSPSSSGAWVTTYDDPSVCAQISYSRYFGYNAGTIKGLQQSNYSDADWISLIETDLNAGRPVQYVGYDPSAGGHTWVCDGFDSYDNMHMNWGWSGANDGYYSIDLLNPDGYDFSTNNEVLVGIEPPAAAANDAGVLAIIAPAGTTCNASITPVIRLENFGSSTLTSCTINYYYDSYLNHTYSWTGSLGTNLYVDVTLPSMTVTAGTHAFTSSTSNPNGVKDGNTANDQSTGSFTIASNPSPLPITEGFEGSTFLPAGWSIWNPNGDATWQIVTTVAHTGLNCIGMNNCDGDDNTDMTGTLDRFITLPYNFTDEANSSLSFYVAYATVTSGGYIYSDTLAVYYSLDCGSTWTQCYLKGGATLATGPSYDVGTTAGCWSPDSTQWRNDVISLASLTGQAGVMFAFENRSGFGGWVYVDDININGTPVTGIISTNNAGPFRIYPNPASSVVTIEGSSTSDKIHFSLYNVLGAELKAGDVATGENRFTYSIAVSDLSQGMYLLRVSDNEHSRMSKVEVR